jgi:hypothetical protein
LTGPPGASCGRAPTIVAINPRPLPRAETATDAEILQLIEDRRLTRLGAGWVDAHPIASSLLSRCVLWTLDPRLKQAAAGAKVSVY